MNLDSLQRLQICTFFVIPAQAGICLFIITYTRIPVCSGMTAYY